MILSEKLKNATGEFRFGMTNDFMFRTVFESDLFALKGLCAALLEIKPEEIGEIEVVNPIKPGELIGQKEVRLDLNVKLNNAMTINIEMQVVNEHNWPERSMIYLSRNFSSINKGEKYINLQPSIHVGILDFPLFDKSTEFYSKYRMMNVKTHEIYSSKMAINVLDLTHIDNATEEDKANNVDLWAKMFKAKTWEELKMIAENNEYIESAVCKFSEKDEDAWARKLAEDREDYLLRQQGMEELIQRAEEALKEREEVLREREEALKESNEMIKEREEALKESNEKIREREEALKESNEKIREREEALKESNEMIKEREESLAKALAEKEKLAKENEALLERIKILES